MCELEDIHQRSALWRGGIVKIDGLLISSGGWRKRIPGHGRRFDLNIIVDFENTGLQPDHIDRHPSIVIAGNGPSGDGNSVCKFNLHRSETPGLRRVFDTLR